MPRNIEYLLEDHISKNHFENFVLTFAIQQRIVVPNELLKKYGPGYGFDNFFSTEEGLIIKKNELQELERIARMRIAMKTNCTN